MKSFEVLGRVTGQQPSNSPIIRLETSFGGGKTHNLIALYHAAYGNVPANVRQRFGLGSVTLPSPGAIQVAGVVGSHLDPSNGVHHTDDDVVTHSLWGELAYQLAGSSGNVGQPY